MPWILRTTRTAAFVTIFLASGCGPDAPTDVLETIPAPVLPPQSPQPPPNPAVGYVWGHVVGPSGGCIPGAVVEIIEGPSTGSRTTQVAPCNAWSYAVGWEFKNLPFGALVKFRATAAGYQPAERARLVGRGGYPVTIELVRN